MSFTVKRLATEFVLVLLLCALPASPQEPARRPPAPVMSAAGADWLTRPERIQEEQPDRMLAALDIKAGYVVADIGAGVGYHAWRMAELVGPRGKVIAEDIQEAMTQKMKENIAQRNLKNVEVILGTPTDPRLPLRTLDLVLMVDVYHEFSAPVSMMNHIKSALKPDGRVVLVEFRKEDPSVPIQPLHKMSIQEVRSELEPLGFRFQKVVAFLPWQHILIFTAN
jgi:ubiquinone/menaquinone biosynthesis C-methylase UbiE